MKSFRSIWENTKRRYAGVVCPIGLAWPLCGCAGVLDPQGLVGEGERLILMNSLGIMLLIVVPTILATLAFGWWFRAGNARAERRPDWAYSGRIELVTWAVPALTVMFLGGIAWIGSHRLDPYRPLKSSVKPLEVEVVSLDWKWLFLYPAENIGTVNQLVVPVGTPIHFRLTSATVMNSFMVPQLGGQIYAMAGMSDQLWLQADRAGTYHGRSTHFSGDGFASMHFDVRAVPPANYAVWVRSTKAQGQMLDRAAYSVLARESQDVAPATYRQTDPSLFEAIVHQTAPPALPKPSKRSAAAITPAAGN